uniref:RNase H type-1 domain-containing protein n=1 Tax=Quercus lobata TaxID=97700 RepID=A0A7N2M257_QUELO
MGGCTCSQIDECLNTVSHKMTPDMQYILFNDFTADEIKAALFQTRPIKASGPDRMNQRNVVVDGGQLKDPRTVPSRNVWQPPPPDVYKLNFDAAIFSDLKCSGFGAIIRNTTGEVVSIRVERGGNMMSHSFAKYVKNIVDGMYWLEDTPPPAVDALYWDFLRINE